MSIKTISSREVYRNRWSSYREDVIERSDGERGLYGVLDKDPACIVIPVDTVNGTEYVWLVRQYRYTVSGTYFELPQGGWETPDVDIAKLAAGELQEETGLTAGRMTHLVDQWIAYGAMRQRHSVFLAQDLTVGSHAREAEEHDMTVHHVPVSEFEEMMLDGRVMDNCTFAAWGAYQVWKRRRPRES